MRTRSKTLASTSTLCMAAVLAVGAVPAQAQTVTLKFAHFLAANSTGHKQVIEPWCADIEKASAGRLKCQIYPAMQLGGTPPQLADQVKNGVADLAWTSPSYSTGRFPRTEALELPFTLPPDGLGGARAMWEYTQKHGMDDYKDFKLLAMWSATNVVISTANKPVLAAAEIKGLKVRSPSRFTSLFLTAVGGTPVNMPLSQATEGIAKGVVDGAMAPWEVLPAIKLDEVTKYHMEGTANQPGFSQTPLAILMNKAKYDSLPADLKAVIDQYSGLPLVERAGRAWDDSNTAAKKKMAAQGNKILIIKDADYAQMKAASASVEQDWAKQAGGRGLDGAKLVAEVRAIGKKYMPK